MTDTDVSVILRRLDKQDSTLSRLDIKLDAHIAEHKEDMQELKPVLQGLSGVKVFGHLVRWFGAVVAAVLVIKHFFWPT